MANCSAQQPRRARRTWSANGSRPTSGRPLQHPKLRELLTYARPGDTVHISQMFRLVRGTGHTLVVLDVLHRDQVALRIRDGAFSAIDLSARHPRTGELPFTVQFMVQALAAAGAPSHPASARTGSRNPCRSTHRR
ncbi:recombinase family protein [Streptomyces sp. NPDC058457]|uniref:recombinase family protein n=1 Tax=Streptomyces sp. NPDC058457 TaxID=3346507 RepID=UPI00365D428B